MRPNKWGRKGGSRLVNFGLCDDPTVATGRKAINGTDVSTVAEIEAAIEKRASSEQPDKALRLRSDLVSAWSTRGIGGKSTCFA